MIGPGRAKDLLFTGRHIDGLTAEQWGLVNWGIDQPHDAREQTPVGA